MCKFSIFQQFCDVMYKRKVWGLCFSNMFRMSSYHLLLSCSILEKIWDTSEFHIRPYCYVWDCTSGLDSRVIVIEGAFESSDTILLDKKKFNSVRTHPEELRVVKSKKRCLIHLISSIIYFSRRVVLRDEFLCYWTFSYREVWCLSFQTHLQSRSLDYPIHLYNLIYSNKALCGILVYLKFSRSWNKTTRDDMRTSETDLKNLNLILYASESSKTTRIDPE